MSDNEVTNYQEAQILVGKTILRVKLNPFSDGQGRKAYDPVIYFRDGTAHRFGVQETDDMYGIDLHIWSPGETNN